MHVVSLTRILRRVDRDGQPAHSQIEERLGEAIVGRNLAPGDRLPPERRMAEQLGVSRMTLRQALGSLARRGLVVRVRGRQGGTFIAEPKVERDLTALAGLTEQLRRQGRRAGAKVLSTRQGGAGRRTATALQLNVGDRVCEVRRLRLSDGEPLAIERSVFPASRFPDLLDCRLDGSLYELLDQRYGGAPRRAVERLEPLVADPGEAELLHVKPGAPLLLVERTAYDAEGIPVEYARDLFRGDRTRVLVESTFHTSPA